MPKYTDKIRASAAEYLSKMAFLFASGGDNLRDEFLLKGELSVNALRLADDAFFATPLCYEECFEDIPVHEQYAEAEAWVLSGWSEPGDEREFV